MKEKIKKMTELWIENDSVAADNFSSRRISSVVKGNVALIGMRRLGKTEYLKYRYSVLQAQNTAEEVDTDINVEEEIDVLDTIFINFDDPIFSTTDFNEKESPSFQAISDSIEELINTEDIKLILIDEIQRRKDWTRWLKGMIDKYSAITFVCTGSDATEMLSSSELGGTRFEVLYIGQYTYSEYSKGAKDVVEKNFIDYIDNNFYPTRKLSEDYNGQFTQIIEKQYATRKIKDRLISLVLKYISLNPGMKLNANNVKRAVSETDGVSVDARQIEKVIDFLLESQLIFRIKNKEKGERVKKTNEYRYYASNFNTHRYFTTFRKYDDLNTTIPRQGLVFENIIISNVYSSLGTDLEREQLSYSEIKGVDVDFSIWNRNIEIKSYDITEDESKELYDAAINKMSTFENPIIVHTGETKTVGGIQLINYEEFLKGEIWKTWKN